MMGYSKTEFYQTSREILMKKFPIDGSPTGRSVVPPAAMDFDFACSVPAVIVETAMPVTVVTVAMMMAEQVVAVMMPAVVIEEDERSQPGTMPTGMPSVVIEMVAAGAMAVVEPAMPAPAAGSGMAAAFFGQQLGGGTQNQQETKAEQQQQSGHGDLRESAFGAST